MKHDRAGCAAMVLAAFASAAPALADDQPRLVSVTILNVANDVARDIGVDASQIPLNVQVPLEVAVGVCGVTADVLTRKSDSGIAQCTAQSTSRGLNDVVQKQVRGNTQR